MALPFDEHGSIVVLNMIRFVFLTWLGFRALLAWL